MIINIPAGFNKKDPIHWLAFGLGSGLSAHAPGTLGTLFAIPVYLLLSQLTPLIYVAVVVFSLFIGVYLCEKTSKDLGTHDFGGIVWDEWVGLWITLFLLPTEWPWVLAGFITFRFFDILKPWPISWLDKQVTGGWGIMLDDVAAGLASWVLLYGFYVLRDFNFFQIP